MSICHRLQRLLLAGEIEVVLGSLTVLADQLGDNKLMNEAVHLHDRYRRLRQADAAELLSPAAYEKEMEQLRLSLQLVIDQLP